MKREMTTTAFNLEGFRITRNLGVVRGITVRSRSIFGTIGAGLQTILVLTGMSTRESAERFPYRPSLIVDSIADLVERIQPTRDGALSVAG